MPRLGESRLALLESLDQRYGPLPSPGAGLSSLDGLTPFEKVVRVALGLVAESRVASAAFKALRETGLLDPKAFAGAEPLEIDDIFKQSRIRLAPKALRPLQRIARWASEREFDQESLTKISTEVIRDDWRGLNGVGPATTDSILLFALGRPAYPVDRASYRILVRHGWLDPSSDFDEARSTLESIAPDDPEALARLSLGFEKLGRDHCRPSSPRCEGCPLQPLLPESGPMEDS